MPWTENASGSGGPGHSRYASCFGAEKSGRTTRTARVRTSIA